MIDENTVFPAWFYGPNGEAEIFEHEAEVPKGWSRYQGKAQAVDAPVETGDNVAEAPKRRGRPPKVAVTEDEF